MGVNLATGAIPCDCNSGILCFIPGIIGALLMGELSILFIEIIARSKIGGITDFTTSSTWEKLSPLVSAFWIIFWAVVIQEVGRIKNMFPGLLPSPSSDEETLTGRISQIPR